MLTSVVVISIVLAIWIAAGDFGRKLHRDKLSEKNQSLDESIFTEDLTDFRLKSGKLIAGMILLIPISFGIFILMKPNSSFRAVILIYFIGLAAALYLFFAALISKLTISRDSIKHSSFKTLWQLKIWNQNDIDKIALDARPGSLEQVTDYFFIELFSNEKKIVRIPVVGHKAAKKYLEKYWGSKFEVRNGYKNLK